MLMKRTFQFPRLPIEIRLRIYELANQPQLEPRCVEICIHPTTGILYSKAAPPPLLHVNSESRQVVLRIYKPWLPQFKDSVAHAPYARLSKLYPTETISRLQNICVHLEHDTLFVRMGAEHLSSSLLGPVEQLHLRQIAMESNPKMPPPFFFCYTIFPGALTESLVMTSTKHVQLLSQLRDLRAIKVCYSGHDEASHQEREFLLRLYPRSRALAEYEWKVLDPLTSTVESRGLLTLEHVKLEELLPQPPKYAKPWTSYKHPVVGTTVLSSATELQIPNNPKLPSP
ncbi:hypothetical protein HYALB_00003826 [Hymenoscyphus albidus]|uniref:2EXR domain-containing protein n=1 Tax=Hymenoscyphus albidus TaxID=595503 RepID=A0A9N9LWM6_9HELO|nr:hypothetical protein HYALB_00003826 [Hymenoscyphus albidus]